MDQEDTGYDIRTRRPIKGVGPVYDNRINSKDEGEMNRQKILFRELLASSVYKSLKAMAYAKCLKSQVLPTDINSTIQWHFNSVRRSFVDDLFYDIERLGKEAPEPEDTPVASDKTRLSFFAEN